MLSRSHRCQTDFNAICRLPALFLYTWNAKLWRLAAKSICPFEFVEFYWCNWFGGSSFCAAIYTVNHFTSICFLFCLYNLKEIVCVKMVVATCDVTKGAIIRSDFQPGVSWLHPLWKVNMLLPSDGVFCEKITVGLISAVKWSKFLI